ncbi:DUF5630 domain-containing protein [Legionella sp. D16C41]|uniref:DUF5630 domain-containing protein n=1 Tax=Legionella sp. D16C41 TaxID=3402688 RepID=UPI003AF9BE9A
MYDFFHAEPKKIQTLKEFLAPDPLNITTNFLNEFTAMPRADQIQKVKKLLGDANQFDFLVKLIILNPSFKEVCNLPLFHQDWLSCWSTYGYLITKNDKALYAQPCPNYLDLFLGIYFYYKACKVAEKLQTDFSQIELTYLKQAIAFNSIHACQRYYAYLYKNTTGKIINIVNEDIEQLYCNIIKNIKQNFLKYYGSYAYLMLAEAYFHYGIYLMNNKNFSLANRTFQVIPKCLEYASILHVNKEDLALTHNASLGGSITTPLHISATPAEIQSLVSKYREIINNQLKVAKPISRLAKQEIKSCNLEVNSRNLNSESIDKLHNITLP